MRDLKLLTLRLAAEIRAEIDPFLLFDSPPALGGEIEGKSRESQVLAPGSYLFSQWSESDFPDPLEGLRIFAGRAAIESKATRGPWILRRVREDGHSVWQGMRELDS